MEILLFSNSTVMFNFFGKLVQAIDFPCGTLLISSQILVNGAFVLISNFSPIAL